MRPTRVTRGSSRILNRGPIGLVGVEQPVTHLLGAVDHRPELEDRERLVLAPHPRLPEQHRAATVDLDRDRDDEGAAARSG